VGGLTASNIDVSAKLVPAIMSIVGEKIWYRPRWFARRVPDPDIEGEQLEHKLAEERTLLPVDATPIG
jgi:RND superfamily putative drug exporter